MAARALLRVTEEDGMAGSTRRTDPSSGHASSSGSTMLAASNLHSEPRTMAGRIELRLWLGRARAPGSKPCGGAAERSRWAYRSAVWRSGLHALHARAAAQGRAILLYFELPSSTSSSTAGRAPS